MGKYLELTINQALLKASEAYKADNIEDAIKLYNAVLQSQPKHSVASHNLGMLAIKIGKITEALPYLKIALEVNPNIPQFWITYINALIKLDRLSEAKSVLENARKIGVKSDAIDQLAREIAEAENTIDPPQNQLQSLIDLYNQSHLTMALEHSKLLVEKFPKSAVLFNIQGAIFKELRQFNESIVTYRKALSLRPHYPDAYNNMGNALKQMGKLEEAIEAYKEAVALRANYVDAWYNMGNALTQQGKPKEAVLCYKKAITIQPEHSDAYNNMGNALKQMGKQEEAMRAYQEAIALRANYADAWYNMANLMKVQGKLKEAIEAYNQALVINPSHANSHFNMGNALKEQGRLKEAVQAYKKALAVNPAHGSASHLISSLTGETTDSAPREYVENLFNEYATRFDHSLVDDLEYGVPEILTKLTVEAHGNASLGSVLDLGCGTGLIGTQIRKFCSQLEGIDLSKKMLELARAKNVYDKLDHVEIVEYLTSAQLDYDYFIAADVFIYVGELSKIFHLIKANNRRPGKLVFSTEHNEREDFILEQTGRYSHSKSYIEKLCSECNFSISHFSKTNLRKENGAFLSGGLYLLDF